MINKRTCITYASFEPPTKLVNIFVLDYFVPYNKKAVVMGIISLSTHYSKQRMNGGSCTALESIYIYIKTHDSESRGQEEAGRTRRMSVLFTGSTAVKFANALNKPP